MLIVTTIYLQNVDSAAEPSATATLATTKLTCADEIIVKKLTEAPDANRQLVTVYAGTNRVSPEGK